MSGTGRNRTERNGKFRKVMERIGTFRDSSEILNSFGNSDLPISRRELCEHAGSSRTQTAQLAHLAAALNLRVPQPPRGCVRSAFRATRSRRDRATPRTQHSALRTGVFGCQALRRRTPEARPLHPYRARKALRAQTCCHRGARCHNSRPGRRPKISFSPDFAGRGGVAFARAEREFARNALMSRMPRTPPRPAQCFPASAWFRHAPFGMFRLDKPPPPG